MEKRLLVESPLIIGILELMEENPIGWGMFVKIAQYNEDIKE